MQNTHTHTNTAEGNAKWEGVGREGRLLREKMQPRDTKKKHQTPARALLLPTTRTRTQHSSTHTTAHAAPCTTHAVHRGEGREARTHAPPAPHTPTSVSLKNRRRVQRFTYRGGEDRGQAPAGTGGMVKGVQGVCAVCGVCEEGALSHTPHHITSHHITSTKHLQAAIVVHLPHHQPQARHDR